MEMFLALGLGLGFSSVAGIRAFLPLALVLLPSILYPLNPPFLILQISAWMNLTAIVALVALAVLECVLDKFAAIERPLNWTMVPMRTAAGATVFALVIVIYDPFVLRGPMSTWNSLTLPEGIPDLAPWFILGAVVAGSVAVAKVLLRQPFERSSSFLEDLAALLAGIVPFLGILLVPLLLIFYGFKSRRQRVPNSRRLQAQSPRT